jgi:hypothetical protein
VSEINNFDTVIFAVEKFLAAAHKLANSTMYLDNLATKRRNEEQRKKHNKLTGTRLELDKYSRIDNKFLITHFIPLVVFRLCTPFQHTHANQGRKDILKEALGIGLLLLYGWWWVVIFDPLKEKEGEEEEWKEEKGYIRRNWGVVGE